MKILNAWCINFGLAIDLFSRVLNTHFLYLNMYGPYVDKKVFWQDTLQLPVFRESRVIMGVDLNFTL
jgi:hypothetical protein